TTDATYVKKLRCIAIPIPNPLPDFFLPQPDFSAASCTTFRKRAVSMGYCSYRRRNSCSPLAIPFSERCDPAPEAVACTPAGPCPLHAPTHPHTTGSQTHDKYWPPTS